MISQHTIDSIHQVSRIEEVIGDFVQLKKRGVNLLGLCPFHNEKTPSFNVNPAKNIFKCFGCGRSGDSITFLMEHEGLSYPDSLRYLARKYNISIEENQIPENYTAEKLERDSLFLVNDFARDFYQQQLFETDLGKSVGLGYFKERGLIHKTLQAFELGFAPSSQKDELTRLAVQKGYNIEFLRRLGLTTEFDRDFFFNRVIFPIHSLSGKVVAFAGRQLTNDKKSPKYLNSRESEIYHKGKVLYGLHLAKQAIRKEKHCLLVEGYMDVLSLHQAGLQNVVASSGTALTTDQISLISRYTDLIYILYDGDPAGIKAALRGIDLILAQDMNVQVVLFPNGEDPDSYVRKVGSTRFQEFVKKESKDFILFKTNLIIEESGGDPVKKAGLIKDIVESLAHIPDLIKRSVYIRQCSELLRLDEQLLIYEVNKIVSQKHRETKIQLLQQGLQKETQDKEDWITKEKVRAVKDTLEHENKLTDDPQEKDLLRILILFGDQLWENEKKAITIGAYLVDNIQDALSSFDNKIYADIIRDYGMEIASGKNPGTDYFLRHHNPLVKNLAIEFCTSPYEYSENWEKRWDIPLQTQPMPDKNFTEDTRQALYRFMLKKYQKMSNENQEEIKKFILQGDEDSLKKHLDVQKMLIERRNEIASKLNTVLL